MKRIILGSLLAAVAAIGGPALAADDTGAWYVAPMGQYTFLDSKRAADDHAGYQVGVGYDFARNWAAEVNGSIASFKVPATLGASQQLSVYSLDFLYKFLPDSVIRPYLLLGGGFMEDRIGGTIEDHEAGTAEAGAGLLIGLGSQNRSTRLQLRTEAKYRMEFLGANTYNPREPGDIVVSAGFQLMFGAPTPQVVRPHRRRRRPRLRRPHLRPLRWIATATGCRIRSINAPIRPAAIRSMRSAAPLRAKSSWSACISPPTRPPCRVTTARCWTMASPR